MVETQDWQETALALRADGKSANEAAEATGKHPATIRKLFARNPVAETNGNGHHATIDAETVERLREQLADDRAERDPMSNDPPTRIEGQTDVYDHLPEDDPDHPGWHGKDEFEAEAGESVGDMPKDPEPDPLGHEVRIAGTRQIAIDFGPNADIPTGGTLVIRSEKMASGHFGSGDLISGTFTARITDVGGKERFDKDFEEFRAKPTSYVATITEVEFD